MQKIQTSKHAYSGLAAFAQPVSWSWAWIRTTFPFRPLTPSQPGFDYEIAGLLAKELGVRLRVYWAYSSHDSYPSKLLLDEALRRDSGSHGRRSV